MWHGVSVAWLDFSVRQQYDVGPLCSQESSPLDSSHFCYPVDIMRNDATGADTTEDMPDTNLSWLLFPVPAYTPAVDVTSTLIESSETA